MPNRKYDIEFNTESAKDLEHALRAVDNIRANIMELTMIHRRKKMMDVVDNEPEFQEVYDSLNKLYESPPLSLTKSVKFEASLPRRLTNLTVEYKKNYIPATNLENLITSNIDRADRQLANNLDRMLIPIFDRIQELSDKHGFSFYDVWRHMARKIEIQHKVDVD